jgi:hypothetical protein
MRASIYRTGVKILSHSYILSRLETIISASTWRNLTGIVLEETTAC